MGTEQALEKPLWAIRAHGLWCPWMRLQSGASVARLAVVPICAVTGGPLSSSEAPSTFLFGTWSCHGGLGLFNSESLKSNWLSAPAPL